MIFVAVGTQKFQLNRLLQILDQLVENGVIQELVFAQTGHSDYIPRCFDSTPFLSKNQFEEMIAHCDLVITHSGVGTILCGIMHGKPVIVFPRLAKYGEHVDDHQLQIAESFLKQNLVLVCLEDDSIVELAQKAREHVFSRYISQRDTVIQTIRLFLSQIQEEKK